MNEQKDYSYLPKYYLSITTIGIVFMFSIAVLANYDMMPNDYNLIAILILSGLIIAVSPTIFMMRYLT